MAGAVMWSDERPLNYNQCQEAVRRLHDYLSHELPPAEEAAVTQHLSECRGCFARFHFEETLLQTIHSRLESLRAPAGMRSRILEVLGASEMDPGSVAAHIVVPAAE